MLCMKSHLFPNVTLSAAMLMAPYVLAADSEPVVVAAPEQAAVHADNAEVSEEMPDVLPFLSDIFDYPIPEDGGIYLRESIQDLQAFAALCYLAQLKDKQDVEGMLELMRKAEREKNNSLMLLTWMGCIDILDKTPELLPLTEEQLMAKLLSWAKELPIIYNLIAAIHSKGKETNTEQTWQMLQLGADGGDLSSMNSLAHSHLFENYGDVNAEKAMSLLCRCLQLNHFGHMEVYSKLELSSLFGLARACMLKGESFAPLRIVALLAAKNSSELEESKLSGYLNYQLIHSLRQVNWTGDGLSYAIEQLLIRNGVLAEHKGCAALALVAGEHDELVELPFEDNMVHENFGRTIMYGFKRNVSRFADQADIDAYEAFCKVFMKCFTSLCETSPAAKQSLVVADILEQMKKSKDTLTYTHLEVPLTREEQIEEDKRKYEVREKWLSMFSDSDSVALDHFLYSLYQGEGVSKYGRNPEKAQQHLRAAAEGGSPMALYTILSAQIMWDDSFTEESLDQLKRMSVLYDKAAWFLYQAVSQGLYHMNVNIEAAQTLFNCALRNGSKEAWGVYLKKELNTVSRLVATAFACQSSPDFILAMDDALQTYVAEHPETAEAVAALRCVYLCYGEDNITDSTMYSLVGDRLASLLEQMQDSAVSSAHKAHFLRYLQVRRRHLKCEEETAKLFEEEI